MITPGETGGLMSRQKWGLMNAFIFGLMPLTGATAPIDWPDLPKDCFVRGRPSTSADLRKGCGTFMLDRDKAGRTEISTGMPLDVAIPQYAWLVDETSGKKTPVILIQAEEGWGIKTVGYKDLESHSFGVALLDDLILLGRKKPSQ